MKSAGKARNNGLYRHIRTSKEIIRNLLNYYANNTSCTVTNSSGKRSMTGNDNSPERDGQDIFYCSLRKTGSITLKKYSVHLTRRILSSKETYSFT